MLYFTAWIACVYYYCLRSGFNSSQIPWNLCSRVDFWILALVTCLPQSMVCSFLYNTPFPRQVQDKVMFRVADIAVVVRLEAYLLFLPCLKRVLRKRGTFRHSLQLYQKQLTCTQRLLLLCPFSEQLTVKVAHLWTFDDIDIWSTGACRKKIRLGFKRENILNEQ